MKRLVLIIIVLLAVSAVAFASEGEQQDQQIKKFQLQNTFIGFGSGSRHHRDSAKLLLGLDITGTTLAVSGGLSLAGSIIVYNGLRAMVGDVTKADIYVSAGVLGAGLVTLIVSRILGWNAPLRY